MTEATMDDIELGPIDFIVIEYPNGRPTGEALPYLLELVDRGTIRILDVALIVKNDDGTHQGITLAELPALGAPEFSVFVGAETGILGEDDIADAASVIDPGSAAAILVYENAWAGPFAAAVRRAGGQLVASGRIPVQGILAALEAADAETTD